MTEARRTVTSYPPVLALRVATAAVAVFAIVMGFVAVGYPSWAWLPVFTGFVTAPAVFIVAAGVAAWSWTQHRR